MILMPPFPLQSGPLKHIKAPSSLKARCHSTFRESLETHVRTRGNRIVLISDLFCDIFLKNMQQIFIASLFVALVVIAIRVVRKHCFL
jgi:hypothetical protein